VAAEVVAVQVVPVHLLQILGQQQHQPELILQEQDTLLVAVEADPMEDPVEQVELAAEEMVLQALLLLETVLQIPVVVEAVAEEQVLLPVHLVQVVQEL
jgi:hypothetical protein